MEQHVPGCFDSDIAAGTSDDVLRIVEGGSPQGYRLYVASPRGTTIDVDNRAETCVSIEADYVIVRGVTCRGAQIDGMRIGNHNHVVIEGCDVSDWGRLVCVHHNSLLIGSGRRRVGHSILGRPIGMYLRQCV